MGYTKVILSGSLLELYEFEKEISERRKRDPKRIFFNTIPTTQRRKDNISKTRKYLRRLIRSNLAGATPPALFTLTMLQILSVPQSWAAHKTFIRRLKHIYGSSLRYISVLEFQKRGAIHFHTLIWGLPSTTILNESRSRHYQHQWQRGFIDCVQTDGHIKLAGYLAKYLSKQMSDPRLHGEKAFSASRNVLRPLSAGGNTTPYEPELIGDNQPLHEHKFDTQWMGRCLYKSYEITPYESRSAGE